MVIGPPGVGKSTPVEYIARQFERCIFSLSMVDPKMTDNNLRRLVANMPTNCILEINEFQRQMEFLNNPDTSVTFAGLLAALDGSARLPEGTIVIITTNENVLTEE